MEVKTIRKKAQAGVNYLNCRYGTQRIPCNCKYQLTLNLEQLADIRVNGPKSRLVLFDCGHSHRLELY